MDYGQLYDLLGALIKSRRKQLSLTQQTLAARLGISRASLANIETGRQKVLVHQLYAFATALNLPPSDLLPSLAGLELDEHWAALPLPDGLKLEQKRQIARLLDGAHVESHQRKGGPDAKK
jgi:transcriptional regulator with XRE-family HTH domain